jgi:hypothetical protein
LKPTALASSLLFPILMGCGARESGYVPVPTKVAPISTDVSNGLDLMPLRVGNRWVYSLRSEAYQGPRLLGSTQETVSYRVESVVGGKARLALERDGRIIDRQVWRADAKGLYQLTAGLNDIPYVPEQPLAIVPIKTGEKFSWSGRGMMADGKTSVGKLTSEILAPQEADTAMGTLSAIPVETHTEWARGKSTNTSWFKPGVGLVRLRQETNSPNGRQTVLLLTLIRSELKP